MNRIGKSALLLLALFGSHCVTAQQQQLQLDWVKTLPNAYIIPYLDIQIGRDGNLVFGGLLTGNFDFDPGPGVYKLNLPPNPAGYSFFAKYDAQGNLLFVHAVPAAVLHWTLNPATDRIVYCALFKGSTDFDPGPDTARITSTDNTVVIGAVTETGTYGSIQDTRLNINQVYDISTNAKGEIYFVGAFKKSLDFDPGPGTKILTAIDSTDGFVAIYDSTRFLDAFALGGISMDGVSSVSAGPNSFIVSGFHDGSIDADPSPGTSILTASGRTGFVAHYIRNPNGPVLTKAYNMGAHVEKLSVDWQSGAMTLQGVIGDSADVDPGPGTTMLYKVVSKFEGFIAHLKANGSLAFARPLRHQAAGMPMSITTSARSGVFMGGNMPTSIDVNAGQPDGILNLKGIVDLFICKYDNSGAVRYNLNFGAPQSALDGKMAVAPNGSIYLLGQATGVGAATTINIDPGTGTTSIPATAGGADLFFARYKDPNTVGVGQLPNLPAAVGIVSDGRAVFIDYTACAQVNATVSVTDINGRLLYATTHRGNDMQRLDVRDIAPGLYIVQVTNQGVRTTGKIVIQ